MCRRLFNHLVLGLPVKALAVAYVLLLAGLCWLAKNKKLGKFLPADADLMPIYAAAGLSAVAVVLGLFSAAVAYYAMWALDCGLCPGGVLYREAAVRQGLLIEWEKPVVFDGGDVREHF